MSDYALMAPYYDLIMQAGYYDYDRIASVLAAYRSANTVLEAGTGTGLILEALADQRPDLLITGVDLTAAMLEIAAVRLKRFPRITLHEQDVLGLNVGTHDLIFSYGGPWYFVPDPVMGAFTMISHIRDAQNNVTGLQRLADHLAPGGTLLLGVQAPHASYSQRIGNSFEYSQQITPTEEGFSKRYVLTEDGTLVMEQVTLYRTFDFMSAIEILDGCGLRHRADGGLIEPVFLEFEKR
jgi:SAM-dependent methyltransferase